MVALNHGIKHAPSTLPSVLRTVYFGCLKGNLNDNTAPQRLLAGQEDSRIIPKMKLPLHKVL